jgi:hypothetical protein
MGKRHKAAPEALFPEMKRIQLYPISCHRSRLEKIVATRRLAVKSRMTQVPTADDVVFNRGRLIVTRSCEKEVPKRMRWEGVHFPWRRCTGMRQVYHIIRLGSTPSHRTTSAILAKFGRIQVGLCACLCVYVCVCLCVCIYGTEPTRAQHSHSNHQLIE